jgi:hypothetical protein
MLRKHTREWTARVHSVRWYCDLCDDHLPEFEEQNVFEAHLKDHHGANLSVSRLRGRLSINKRYSRGAFACPLCTHVSEYAQDEDTESRYQALWEHVSHHLGSIALLSLPHISEPEIQVDGIQEDTGQAQPSAASDTLALVGHRESVSVESDLFDGSDDLGDDLSVPLVEQILKSFQSSNFDGLPRDFLPIDAFERLATKSAIFDELNRLGGEVNNLVNSQREKLLLTYNTEELQDLATWVFNEARRLFLITICCDLRPLHLVLAMDCFRKTEVSDVSLPLSDPRSTPPPATTWVQSVWTPSRLRDFYEKQWKILVPVFGPQTYDYNFERQCTLPFLKEESAARTGAFGSVYKIKIPRQHLQYDGYAHVSSLILIQAILNVYIAIRAD